MKTLPGLRGRVKLTLSFWIRLKEILFFNSISAFYQRALTCKTHDANLPKTGRIAGETGESKMSKTYRGRRKEKAITLRRLRRAKLTLRRVH